MDVILADALGMCFGVRDALAATAELADPHGVTIHGELVHNPIVERRLRARGFFSVPESARGLPATERVLITAHGVSDRERARLRAAGKTLVDTTCPLVSRAHRAATQLAGEGRHVVIIGRPGHVEVEGLTGDLPSFTVVSGPGDAPSLPHPRLGVVAQTTTPVDHAARTLAAVRRANPAAEIRWVDTVCQPTKDRQAAVARLVAQVDAVVVVGGRGSNNTRQLVARCAAAGVVAHHVEGPETLRAGWFEGVQRVGLTAGTSTLPETVAAVRQALESMPGRAAARQPRGLSDRVAQGRRRRERAG